MKFSIFALGFILAVNLMPASALADSLATKGQMLYDSNAARVATVHKVNDDGSVMIILDGKVITIPVNTLSIVDGHLTTNMTKNQVSLLD
jgi:hypothetical protein